MTEKEWINIGYTNRLINCLPGDVSTFREVYHKWFLYKRSQIRPQSLDRIECTYMKYYETSPLASMQINEIDEQAVIDFLNNIFAAYGFVTMKEYQKIFQIVSSVLCYALDFHFAGGRLLNWKVIREYTYNSHIVSVKRDSACVKDSDIRTLQDFVLSGGYSQKQSSCLLLLFNFYAGLRIGELAALLWQDVDFEKRLLYVSRSYIKCYNRDDTGQREGVMSHEVSDPKTVNSIRTVPLCDKAVIFLRLLRKHHEKMGYSATLHLSYDGRDTIAVRSLEYTLERICQLAGIPAFGTHMIRKTVATKMHYAGIPTRQIADILGHADISTTEKCYILSDSEYFQTMSQALNNVFTY